MDIDDEREKMDAYHDNHIETPVPPVPAQHLEVGKTEDTPVAVSEPAEHHSINLEKK
jgi:hypothetical protein